jgi:hypothetical protein
MSQTNPTRPGLQTRFRAELRRAPTRAAVLGVLVVVFLIVGVSQVAKHVGWPKRSSAAARPGAAVPAPSKPTGGTAKAARPESTGSLSELIGPARPRVSRDIFTPDETYFPIKTKDPAAAAPKAPKVLDPNAVAEAKRRETEARARALVLQTTVVGEFPTAMINGRVLRIGDAISGFKIVEISSRSCQLERNGIRVLLEMGS